MEADLGFAKAYMNGDHISFVDKNEGLLHFFLINIANNEMNTDATKLNKKRGWWTPLLYSSTIASVKYFLKNISNKNTLSRARRNILQHYELTNEFFLLLMGETMEYSCATFQARIKKEHHILEIGCGWGSFALEVVRKTGCRYTGITLSGNQLKYMEARVKEAGLLLESNGMIEHVGHEFMDEYFKCCEAALQKNGLLVLQFSTVGDNRYDEWRQSRGFIKEYIFPGGCMPSLNRVISAMAAASRLSVVHLEEKGTHYVDTLRIWRQNLLQNQSQILAMGFNEEFIRMWEYYFDYCAAGYQSCILRNYQIVFSRHGDVATLGTDPSYNQVPSAIHNITNA